MIIARPFFTVKYGKHGTNDKFLYRGCAYFSSIAIIRQLSGHIKSSAREKLPVKSIKGGRKTMTSKELNYVEDALGHEQFFLARCREIASSIQDADLRNYVEQMAQKHRQIFQSFYGLL